MKNVEQRLLKEYFSSLDYYRRTDVYQASFKDDKSDDIFLENILNLTNVKIKRKMK